MPAFNLALFEQRDALCTDSEFVTPAYTVALGRPEAAVNGEVQLVVAPLPGEHQALQLKLKLEDGLWACR